MEKHNNQDKYSTIKLNCKIKISNSDSNHRTP